MDRFGAVMVGVIVGVGVGGGEECGHVAMPPGLIWGCICILYRIHLV